MTWNAVVCKEQSAKLHNTFHFLQGPVTPQFWLGLTRLAFISMRIYSWCIRKTTGARYLPIYFVPTLHLHIIAQIHLGTPVPPKGAEERSEPRVQHPLFNTLLDWLCISLFQYLNIEISAKKAKHHRFFFCVYIFHPFFLILIKETSFTLEP